MKLMGEAIPEELAEGNKSFKVIGQQEKRDRDLFILLMHIDDVIRQFSIAVEELLITLRLRLKRLEAFERDGKDFDLFGERPCNKTITHTANRNHSASLKTTLLIFMVMVSTAECYCRESSTTVNYVKDCPQNKTEWERRAQLKACSLISQTCTDSSGFQYHCVLNSRVDQLIEVCAPIVFVSEYCCEYNQRGAVIQRNYDAKCMTFRKPCNTSYYSYESYNFPGCYELVLKNKKRSTDSYVNLRSSTETISDTNTWNQRTKKRYITSDEGAVWFLSLIVGVIAPIAAVTVLVCVFQFREHRSKGENSERERTDSEEPMFVN